MRYLIFMSLMLPAALAAGCRPVAGDRILGSDLAAADRKFSALPRTMQFGYAPLPGVTRVFAPPELRGIARAVGIAAADFGPICFELPLHVPADADFLESMRRALPVEATLHLVDMARAPIPAGKTEFPLSGLEPPAAGNDGVQLWRGFVQYTDTRKAAVWARVSVTETFTAVVAAKDLTADTPIDLGSLRVETRTGPLKRDPVAKSPQQVAGRIVHRPIRSGGEILLSLLGDPPAIRRGDVVRVEVRSGSALLRFDAVALTSVKAGDFAEFRNPASGKTFRARAETGDRAVIVVGTDPVL